MRNPLLIVVGNIKEEQDRMIEIGLGISFEKNPALAAEEAARKAKKNRRPGKADLALLFCSSDLPLPPLLKMIGNLLEGTPVVGLSGAAVFSQDGVAAHGLQLMLLSFPPDIRCSTACVRNLKGRPSNQAGEEMGEQLLSGFKNMQRSVALTLFDRVIEHGHGFVMGLQEYLGSSFPCVGAFASDSFSPTANRVLHGLSAVSDGCCGVLWGGKIGFGFGLQHGWKPLGKPHTITGADGNIIRTINNMPAVRLYEEYLATTQAGLKNEIEKLSVFYPLGMKIEGADEYLIRNIVSIEDDGALHCQGNVPQGATVRLMISTKETCLSATSAAVTSALTSLASPMTRPIFKEHTSKFAIAFSSFSRYTLLRRDAAKELEVVKQALGDIPFIGLYTASELAPLSASGYHGHAHFHNQSFSCLILEG